VKRKNSGKRNRSDYEIGFGRPPKATQFKKGTSGNKKGRPKGSKNIATLFHEAMHQRVAISENGQRRTITKIEAALTQLANKAATGDPKAIQASINIARELGDLKLPDPSQGSSQVVRFGLRVFEKNPETGESVRVKPLTREEEDDDEE
jgi:hypothetical protein